MVRKPPGSGPRSAAPPAPPAEPPGTEPCRGACARHIPLTQKRVPRERGICGGQLAPSDSSSGSGNAARNLPRPRQPAASLLPRQRRTRGFVPVSPGMEHSSLPQPAPALPAARVTRPGDKGLAGTFSKSPWKAPEAPRPSALSAHPWHPGAPRPLLPQQHPRTALAAPNANGFRMKEPFFSPKSSTPRPPSPSAKRLERGRARQGQGSHSDPPRPALPSPPGAAFRGDARKAGNGSRAAWRPGPAYPSPHQGPPWARLCPPFLGSDGQEGCRDCWTPWITRRKSPPELCVPPKPRSLCPHKGATPSVSSPQGPWWHKGGAPQPQIMLRLSPQALVPLPGDPKNPSPHRPPLTSLRGARCPRAHSSGHHP